MAVVTDISGWQDEYLELETRWDEQWVAFLDRWTNKIRPKIPVSQVLDFMECLLEHEETRDVVEQLAVWDELNDAKGPFDEGDPELEKYPRDSVIYMNEFWLWYCWKAGYEPVYGAFRLAGSYAAELITLGRLPGVYFPETTNFLLKRYDYIFKSDQEGQSV